VRCYSEADQGYLDLVGVSGERVRKAIETDQKIRLRPHCQLVAG
jgi:hypothetical protein